MIVPILYTVALVFTLALILEKLKLLKLFLKNIIWIIILFTASLIIALADIPNGPIIDYINSILPFDNVLSPSLFVYIISIIVFILLLLRISLYVRKIRTNLIEELIDCISGFFKNIKSILLNKKMKVIIKDLEKKTRVDRDKYNIIIPQIKHDTGSDVKIEEKFEIDKYSDGLSFLILYDYTVNREKLIGSILSNYLINKSESVKKEFINYICADKPSFIINDYLINYVKNSLNMTIEPSCFSNKIFYIDAYSKNFSFKETLFKNKSKIFESINNFNVIPAKSLGDIHSATVKSYKKILNNVDKASVQPALCVVYDTLTSMCDPDHLLGYFTHCLVAEKQYKMITFIFEKNDVNKEYIDKLKYLVDYVVIYKSDKKGNISGTIEKR